MSRIAHSISTERQNSAPGANHVAPYLRSYLLNSTALAGYARVAIWGIAGVISLDTGSNAYALPEGGVVAGGAASITGTQGALTIGQSSQNAVINWRSFGIGRGEAVTFQSGGHTCVRK